MKFFTTSDMLGRSGPYSNCIDYTIWYIMFALLTVGLIVLLNMKKSQKAVKISLIVFWAIAVLADIIKIIVSVTTDGFVLTGSLPLYICSIFMYAMPFAIWGKGKVKDAAATFVCTIGLFGVFMNYVIPSVTVNHSLLSFWGLHTTIYHSMLIITPFVMLCTGYHKIKIKDFGWAFLGFVALTIAVVLVDYIIKADYMYFRTGETTQLGIVMNIASATGFFWPVLMYVGYAIVQLVMTGLIIGVDALVKLVKRLIDKKKPVAVEASKDTNTKDNE